MLSGHQIEIILKDLLEQYGIDFYFYSRDSFDRRINRLYKLEKYSDFESFRQKVRSDKDYIDHFIDRITVNVTEMFRDPAFFLSLRHDVIPRLASLPQIRVWHPGCSSGEEVLSLAILLHESGLLHKSEILGTDLNSRVLAQAENAVYPNSLVSLYEKNYVESGGRENFSDYYETSPEGARFAPYLRNACRFTLHNLAAGEYLGRFDLIVCRNVLIYFDRAALQKTFNLFDDSTGPFSYLALGEKETLQFSTIGKKFSRIEPEKIWKKTA